jgi:serine/threonine protein kinase
MGCEFDFAIDMWSFGCIMYEIITSNVLFKSVNVQMNLCKAAALTGLTDFSIFRKGMQYKKYILKDKYIYTVGPMKK